MPKFLFFDTNKETVDAYEKYLGEFPGTRFVQGQVQKIAKNYEIDSIVSPANSFGIMTGGIDLIYTLMFHDIQHYIQDFIKAFDLKTTEGQPHLPIGSAIVVPIRYFYGEQQVCRTMMCVPTMYLPQNITGTRNVYYAFLAILNLTKNWDLDRVVAVPGLGTGVGGVSPEKCAQQCREALKDYLEDTYTYPEGVKLERGRDYYVLSKAACEQRNVYCNDIDYEFFSSQSEEEDN